jgi:type I restriction enzyme S subunit
MPVNIGDNVINEHDIARVGSDDVKRLARHRLRAGDIVFGRRGEIGRRSIVREQQSGWLCGTGCLAVKFGNNLVDVNPEFVALYVGARAQQNWLIERAVGGTMPNLNTQILSDLPLDLPHRSEQDSVVHALDDIMATERLLRKAITKKRAIKQGMMQELLTGSTRLPGFDSEWEDSDLGFLARVVGGGTPSTKVPAYWGGNVPWFTPGEIDARGSGLVEKSERTITQEGLASSSANILPAGTVLVTTRASLGNCAVGAVPVTTNQGFQSLVPVSLKSTWFLYYWIQQNKCEFESRAAGSTFLEIGGRKVSEIPVRAPSLEEQEAIGRALCDADAEIKALERRLEATRDIKQGMMQELLTGRTRLPIGEEVTV